MKQSDLYILMLLSFIGFIGCGSKSNRMKDALNDSGDTAVSIGVTLFQDMVDDIIPVECLSEPAYNDEYPIVTETEPEIIIDEDYSNHDNKVFDATEQMPSFPGSASELLKYINTNLNYPKAAAESNIQGTVLLRFVVLKDGSIGEVRVVRSIDPELDREAIRIVKGMPKFNPGRMNGIPVNVWFTLPVRFKLQT